MFLINDKSQMCLRMWYWLLPIVS